MKSNVEVFSPELLQSKRLQRGFSLEFLSKLSRLKQKTIRAYEEGRFTPSKSSWSCLCRILNMTEEELELSLRQGDTWTTQKEEWEYKPVSFSFNVGHCYVIRDTPYSNGAKYECEINPMSGNFCIFKYEGKTGIHHKFIEVKGRWSRTYTDQQLIGKVIKEVNDDEQA